MKGQIQTIWKRDKDEEGKDWFNDGAYRYEDDQMCGVSLRDTAWEEERVWRQLVTSWEDAVWVWYGHVENKGNAPSWW